MKYLLTTLLLVVSSIGYSQDTLRIPTEEMEEFFLALDTLRFQDSIQTDEISDLETEIILFNKLTQQDSLLLFYKDQEIDLLKESISLYNERLKQVDKWYNKPAVSFAGGFLSTILLIKVIDYTLPE